MRNFILFFCFLLACSLQVCAQNYVSTTPSNRNVIIEEFTGRNCGYCPDGHRIANEIMANNPRRVWAINIHAGGYAPTSYPNFNTTDGTTIHNGFSIGGYPCGAVNRNGNTAIYRDQWANAANTQLAQAAEANIAGICIIDPITHIATINVEVYYTADAEGTTNKLTVAMLQNNILGSQSGMSSNPSQIINGQYNHMHIMRDVITTSAWGDEVSPITQGTLIQKEYEYQIPENIGTPNGVDVVIDDLEFLAWVSKTNYNIITACKLQVIFGTDEPVYPGITGCVQEHVVSCSNTENAIVSILNGGLDELTTMNFEIDINGETQTYTWNGSLPSYEGATITIPIEVSEAGTFATEISIVEANGVAIEPSAATVNTLDIEKSEWVDHEETTGTIKVRIWQDRFGPQTTWALYASDYSVLAEGGPYSNLPSNGIQLREKTVAINSDDCIKFTIYDSEGNGINNGHGEGHYELVDENENIIIEGDGVFEYEESSIFSITIPVGVNNYEKTVSIYPNPVNNTLNIKDAGKISSATIFDIYGRKALDINTVSNSIDVSSLANGIYILRVNIDGVSSDIKFIKE